MGRPIEMQVTKYIDTCRCINPAIDENIILEKLLLFSQ